MLVFEERGKLEYPEKNLSEQGREPITNGNYEKCKITVHSIGNHTYCAVRNLLLWFYLCCQWNPTRQLPSHTVWFPILIGSALVLSKIRKLCCKSNHSAISSTIIEAAFLRLKFTPRGKIFRVLWSTVIRSEFPGRSSMDGFFPYHAEKYWDQSKWSLTTFDLRQETWLAALFLHRILTSSETDETLTQLTQVYMCHAISFMTYDVSDLERFPISSKVMLSIFLSQVRIFVFDFSCLWEC